MPLTPFPDLHALRHEIANLFDAADHDVELNVVRATPKGGLCVNTTLHSTPRSSNASGTIYGSSLFSLGDLTSSMALLLCLLDTVQEHQTPIVCTTRGGTITYLQAATGDVSCELMLSASFVQSLCVELRQQHRAIRTLSLDMHDATGQRVAQATLTLSARRLREGTAQRLPTVAGMANRLQSLLAPRGAYVMR